MPVKKHYIHRRIEEGEHLHQDFKFEISDARKIARSLVAFANTEGGRLLVGVKDNGKIVGVSDDEELYMIEAALKMYVRPRLKCKTNAWSIEGRTVVEIAVEPGSAKPYFAPNDNGKWTVYLRQNDSNVIAHKLLVKSWQRKRSAKGLLIPLNNDHKILIDLLRENEFISFSRFLKKARIPVKLAEQILVDLMALDIIESKEIDAKTVFLLKKNQTL